MGSKEALIVRSGPWDITPAQRRAAACLTELGYRVTILAWDVTGKEPTEEYINGWRVRRFHKYYPSHSVKFVLYWPHWWRWVMRELRGRQYELVHAMNLESVFPCILSRRRRKFHLIYDLRDAWGQGADTQCFPIPQGLSAAERWSARHVDGLLLSQGRLDRMGVFFGRRVRTHVPTIQVLNVPEKDMAGSYQPPATSRLRLNVSGNISYLRNLRAILQLARRRPDVTVDVVGEVRDVEMTREAADTPNVHLFGRVAFPEAIRLMSEANLVAVMYDVSSKLAVVSSANKMFESMMMSRPYIASAGGFPGAVAESAGVGWVVAYDDVDALVELVDRLREDPTEIERAARAARETYCKHFRWEVQKANLVAMYKYVLEGEIPLFRQEADWKRIIGTTFQLDSVRPAANSASS